jgi:serine/threonine-protein kinase
MNAVKICPQCGQRFEGEMLFCPRDGSALRPAVEGAGLVGQVVADRYLIQRELGHGGMGQVYLAEHVKIGRRYALKVIKPGLVASADAVSRFNREAANASRIAHPNVVQVYDFGESSDGLVYFAMELVEGESLAALVQRETALPPARVAAITRQIADALAAAHDLRIVHRDLKPENVMLAKQRDGTDQVKVVDFGVSRIMDDDAQKVTKTGLVIGTLEYMSPEQFTGEAVDGRSDQYSLGIIVFRMLTGTLPFVGKTALEAMEGRVITGPPRLAAVRPDVEWPAPLQAVLDRALSAQPEKRFADVTALSQALDAAVRAWHPAESGAAAPPLALPPPPRPASPQEAAPVAAKPAVVLAPERAVRASGPWHRARGMRATAAVGGIGILAIAITMLANPGGSLIPGPDSVKQVVTNPDGGSGQDDRGGTRGAAVPTETTGADRPTVPRPSRPDSGASRAGTDPVALTESADVRRALDSLELLTEDGTNAAQNLLALEMAERLEPVTPVGRVARKFRMLEAHVNLDRYDDVFCRLLSELDRESRGTRFRDGVALYRQTADSARTCR